MRDNAKIRLIMAENRLAAERSLGIVFSAGLVMIGFLGPDTTVVMLAFLASFSYLLSLLLSSHVVELELTGHAVLEAELNRLKKSQMPFRHLSRLDWSWVPALNIVTFVLLGAAIYCAV